MSAYYIDFNNNTGSTWTMGVYQELPNSIGLESVSWKQTTVPTMGSIGGIGVYKASQTLVTELGSVWECVFQDNVQQLVQSTGTAPADSIIIKNTSNKLANLGIGMSGQGSVFKNSVVSGAKAQFQVTPTYFAGLFNNLVLGEVISSNVSVGPQEIVFPDGMNCATVTASMSGENIKMSVAYSQVSMVSREVLDRLLSIQQERTGILLEHD
jgi:rhizosphere induced protein